MDSYKSKVELKTRSALGLCDRLLATHSEIDEGNRNSALSRLRSEAEREPEIFLHTENREFILGAYLFARYKMVVPRNVAFAVQDNIARVFVNNHLDDVLISESEKIKNERKIALEVFGIIENWIQNRY